MRTEVSTLIAALKTERTALSRAIDALEAMSGGEKATKAKPVLATRARRRRVSLTREQKAAICGVMSTAGGGEGRRTAAALAREYGANEASIYNNWRTWQRDIRAERPVSEIAQTA